MEVFPASAKYALGKLIKPLIPWLFFDGSELSELIANDSEQRKKILNNTFNTYRFYLNYGAQDQGVLKLG